MESDFDAVLRIIRRCGWACEILSEGGILSIECKNIRMIFDAISGQMKDMIVYTAEAELAALRGEHERLSFEVGRRSLWVNETSFVAGYRDGVNAAFSMLNEKKDERVMVLVRAVQVNHKDYMDRYDQQPGGLVEELAALRAERDELRIEIQHRDSLLQDLGNAYPQHRAEIESVTGDLDKIRAAQPGREPEPHCTRTYQTVNREVFYWCSKPEGHTDAHRWNDPPPPAAETRRE